MNTAGFLSAALPSAGFLALMHGAYTTEGTLSDVRHDLYASAADLAEAALRLDASGREVYFCTSSLTSERTSSRISARTKDNASQGRVLPLDIDIGAADKGQYVSQADALVALRDWCNEHFVMPTLVVGSGTGLHVYWRLTQDRDAAAMLALRQGLARHISQTAPTGLSSDLGATRNIVSVLRVPGTTHRKNSADHRTVDLWLPADGDDLSLLSSEWENKLGAMGDTGGASAAAIIPSILAGPPPVLPNVITTSVPQEYDDAPIPLEALSSCALAEQLLNDGPAGHKYNVWWRMAGVFAHADQADVYIERAKVAANHGGQAKAERSIQEWLESSGPPKCSTLAEHDTSDACETCPFRGWGKDPLTVARRNQNGIEQQAVVEQVIEAREAPREPVKITADLDALVPREAIDTMPAVGDQYEHEALHRFGTDRGGVYYEQPPSNNDDDEGPTIRRVSREHLSVAAKGITDDEIDPRSTVLLRVGYPHLEEARARLLTLPARHVGNRQRVLELLSEAMIAPQPHARTSGAMKTAQDRLLLLVQSLYEYSVTLPDTPVGERYGWQLQGGRKDDYRFDRFLVGETLYRKGQHPLRVIELPGRKLYMAERFRRSGSLRQWSEAFNVYAPWFNDETAYAVFPRVMSFLAGFAAPLMQVANAMQMPGFLGCAVNVWGASGFGKSSALVGLNTAWMAASINQNLSLANATSSKRGLELVHVQNGHLPFVFDEITSFGEQNPEELTEFIFNITALAERTVANTEGGILNRGRAPATILFSTANKSLEAKIQGSTTRNQKAEMQRVLDIPVPEKYADPTPEALGMNAAKDFSQNFGLAGPAYITWVMDNIDEVRGMLEKNLKRFSDIQSAKGELRLKIGAATCFCTALEILTKLGINTGYDMNLFARTVGNAITGGKDVAQIRKEASTVTDWPQIYVDSPDTKVIYDDRREGMDVRKSTVPPPPGATAYILRETRTDGDTEETIQIRYEPFYAFITGENRAVFDGLIRRIARGDYNTDQVKYTSAQMHNVPFAPGHAVGSAAPVYLCEFKRVVKG